MKKLVITAIVAVACFSMSQGQGLVSSQSTNHPGGVWVQSTNGITLNINDIITITAGGAYSGSFVTPADLSAPKVIGNAGFTVQSNRVFDVCVKAASANFTASNTDVGIYGPVGGDNTNMPASVLSLALVSNNTGGGLIGGYFSPLSSYHAVPTSSNYTMGASGGPGTGFGNLLIQDAMPGGNNSVYGNSSRSFNVSYAANPGWAYAGGTYAMNVVYTAAQE